MIPAWFPTGMTWWEAIGWTLVEIALFFGVPLGLVALSGAMKHLGERAASTWRQKGNEGRQAGLHANDRTDR